MNQKRQHYDPLAPNSAIRWLVRVDLYRNVIDVLELAPSADLRAALAGGIAELQREGWEIEGVSFSGTFVRRDGVRHPGKALGEMWGAR